MNALALLAVHCYLDQPCMTLEDARLQIPARIDRMARMGLHSVFLGSRLGPESTSSTERDHRRSRLVVQGRPLPLMVADVAAMRQTAAAMQASNSLSVLLLNAYRLVQGMWVPTSAADWLQDVSA